MNLDLDEVQNCLCLNARMAARHLSQIYDVALRPAGLRVTQFQLLSTIERAEAATNRRLAGLMGMDRTTLTRNLALLERDDLVEVQPGEGDRRERHYRLTAKGREALAQAMPLWRTAQREMARELSGGQSGTSAETVLGLLQTLGTVVDRG